MSATQRTPQEVESLVTLLLVACDDANMTDTLAKLLSMPDQSRKDLVAVMIDQFRKTHAPRELTEAFACVLDDRIAEKAYEVIYQCKRPEK